MDLIALDDRGQLFLSSDIDDWASLEAAGINVIIDLDGGIDEGVPTIPDRTVYLFFPFNDAGLPDPARLHAVARFGALLIRGGQKVLSHCGMGYNRSALVAGLIMRYLGMSGPDAVAALRQRRPGALYNAAYADYVANCALEA